MEQLEEYSSYNLFLDYLRGEKKKKIFKCECILLIKVEVPTTFFDSRVPSSGQSYLLNTIGWKEHCF